MDEVIPNEINDLINFTEENKKNFFKYSKVRSMELYYDVALFLKHQNIYAEEKIDYEIVNDCIRLDKSIKNILYRFLSTYEEQIKTSLLENYKFENCKFIKVKSKSLFPNNEVKDILSNWKSWSKNLGTGKFKNIFLYISKEKNFSTFFNQKELSEINSLRNKVMHHSLLIFTNEGLDFLARKILVLKEQLLEPWSRYLKEQIEESLKKREAFNKSEYRIIMEPFYEIWRI